MAFLLCLLLLVFLLVHRQHQRKHGRSQGQGGVPWAGSLGCWEDKPLLIHTSDCPQGPSATRVRSRGPRRGEAPGHDPPPSPLSPGAPCAHLFFPHRLSPAVDIVERTPGNGTKSGDRPGRGELGTQCHSRCNGGRRDIWEYSVMF